MKYEIPKTQRTVQVTGPDTLVLNAAKPVVAPGKRQILCRVESIGLCFSDLKLIKQFTSHVRKGPVTSGIDQNTLSEISSYVPDSKPTVPGHEAVVRICAVGEGVASCKPGQRFLVQTDYRWLLTANSNAAFGYNFEGALQEYVLMDERVITSPQGDSMLIPAPESLSASSIALVEPWACVEDSYASKDRAALKKGGRMLVVVGTKVASGALEGLFEKYGAPGEITWFGEYDPEDIRFPAGMARAKSPDELKDAYYDDFLFFGSRAEMLEPLFRKIAPQGLLNIVLCGGRFGRPVVTAVGRVHYGGIRIVGTTGSDPCESMKTIPPSGEIRAGDLVNVVGAGGPMGAMHVIRNLCQGVEGVTVFAGDLDDDRLAALSATAEPLAQKYKAKYRPYNPRKENISEQFDYAVIMAPVPALVAGAVKTSARGAIINIFAGIPATVTGEMDLDAYVERKLYFIGTSGSVLEDMKLVLAKVSTGSLDTNLSVAAVSGLDGAVEGIRAVEKASVPGKIVVYPQCRGLGLVPLPQLPERLPEVAKCLENGVWTKRAETKLMEIFAREA